MLRFAIVCAILDMGKQYASGETIEGYEYVEEAKSWLRLHIIPETWLAARLRCHLEGGVLVTPTTNALADAMKTRMDKNTIVFTGFYGGMSKGDYLSIEGVHLSDTTLQWATGQPANNNNAEDCITMGYKGTISTTDCKSTLPYFCRKETQVLHKKCSSTDPEYVYSARTDKCYRFHRVARTWHNAAKACLASQGHLVVISSTAEAKVITNLFSKNPVNTIVGATNPNYASVGFWNWNDMDNEWLTVFGQTLTEAGYEKWKAGEPNNYKRAGEHCGSVWRLGGFNDIMCYRQRYPFICETDPVVEEATTTTTTEPSTTITTDDESFGRHGAEESSRLSSDGLILPPITTEL